MPSALRALVVDDEEPARRRIRSLLEEAAGVELAGECDSGAQAVREVARIRPDVLFLDVQMPDCDGFEVLARLGPAVPAAVVMVTAYDRYALRAFDVSAVDYLLKPFTQERFTAALDRARSKLNGPLEADAAVARLLSALQRQTAQERLVIRSREGVQFVDAGEVDWMEADGNYTVLHLGRHELRIRETVTELERRLAEHAFVRIHRSFIVNRARIHRIEPWSSGEYVIVLRDGTKIQSSRSYTQNVQRLLG